MNVRCRSRYRSSMNGDRTRGLPDGEADQLTDSWFFEREIGRAKRLAALHATFGEHGQRRRRRQQQETDPELANSWFR